MARSHIIILLISAAIAIRIGLLLTAQNRLAADEVDYFSLSIHVAGGEGYTTFDGEPTAYRPPGYSYFLAGLFSILPSFLFVRIIQSLLEGGICVFLFLIGKKIFSDRAGIIAALTWSLFPSGMIMPLQIMGESLFTFLFFWLMYLQFPFDSSKKITPYLSGIIGGAMILIKPQMIVVFLAILAYRFSVKDRAWIRSLPVLAGTMALAISPWLVRNVELYHALFISTNGGVNFWIGNNPEATGGYKIPSNDPLSEIADEKERNDRGYALGIDFILHHPGRSVSLAVKKAAYILSSQNYLLLTNDDGNTPPTSYLQKVKKIPWWKIVLVNLPYLAILFAGGAGFVLLGRKYLSTGSPIHLVAAAWFVTHILFFGAPRFGYPALPLFVLSGAALAAAPAMMKTVEPEMKWLAGVISFLLLFPTIIECNLAWSL